MQEKQGKVWAVAYFTALAHAATLTAVPWLSLLVAGLSLWRPGFDPKPVHVEFMVDKVALGQVRNQEFLFSPVIIIAPMLHTHSSATNAAPC